MYEIAKSVIERRDYELDEMIKDLKALKLSGDITEEQLTELMALARENADATASVDVIARLDELEKRVSQLEKAEPSAPGTYPEYVSGKPARNGEKYMWKGKIYQCVLPEHVDVCVWSPDTYPAYWKEVKE